MRGPCPHRHRPGQHHPSASPASPHKDFPPRKQPQKNNTNQKKPRILRAAWPLKQQKPQHHAETAAARRSPGLHNAKCSFGLGFMRYLHNSSTKTKFRVCCYRTGNIPTSVLNTPTELWCWAGCTVSGSVSQTD